jgi:ribose 5-phosphate isomerase A
LKRDQELVEKEKKNAAVEAAKHVKDGFVVGLGSGSTVAYAIEEIGKRIRRHELHVLGVPTSYQAMMLAIKHKIPLTTLEEYSTLDLAIDGADQIDSRLNLIKGMGGALTREKIVASASKKVVIVANKSKKVKVLGEKNHPVPIEVLPFAISVVVTGISKIGGKSVLREAAGKVGPVVTDNGNVIVDAQFGLIRDPEELMQKVKIIPGVVETGLFVNMVDIAYVGAASAVEKIEKS